MTAPKPPLAHFVIVLLMCSLLIAQTKKPAETNNINGTGPTTIEIGKLTEPYYFVIVNDAGCEMVRVTTNDGKVTFGKCYKPTEAAEAFWTYLGGKSPAALQKRIDELEAEVKKLKAGTNGK